MSNALFKRKTINKTQNYYKIAAWIWPRDMVNLLKLISICAVTATLINKQLL